MATTYDLSGGSAAIPSGSGAKVFIMENTVNLANDNVVASAVIQALDIPAGTLVLQCGLIPLTAEGGTLTATLGDGDTVNGWDASTMDLNQIATQYTSLVADTNGATGGKYYATADTIDVVTSANAGDLAKFKVWALCLDI